MDRLQAFEAMLSDIQAQCEQEKKAMDEQIQLHNDLDLLLESFYF